MFVSVIIQGYQDRGFFDECINSVLQQTFTDYELIFSSDGNADLKNYADRYNIPFVISSKVNHSYSVNLAVKQCSGDWVKVLDDDDLLAPNYLQDMYDNRNKGDLLYGDCINFFGEEKKYYKAPDKIKLGSLLPIINNPINWSTVFINKEVFLKLGGFDENVQFANDYDLYLNFLINGYKLSYVNKLVSYYRYHNGQMSKREMYLIPKDKEYLQNKYMQVVYNEMMKYTNDDLGWPQ